MLGQETPLAVSSGHLVRPFSDNSAAYVFTTSPPTVRILDELAWATLSLADGSTLSDVENAFRAASLDETALAERGRAITLDLIDQGILVAKDL